MSTRYLNAPWSSHLLKAFCKKRSYLTAQSANDSQTVDEPFAHFSRLLLQSHPFGSCGPWSPCDPDWLNAGRIARSLLAIPSHSRHSSDTHPVKSQIISVRNLYLSPPYTVGTFRYNLNHSVVHQRTVHSAAVRCRSERCLSHADEKSTLHA